MARKESVLNASTIAIRLLLAIALAGVLLFAARGNGGSEADADEGSAPARHVAADAGATAELQRILAEIKAADVGQLAISEEDGRFLRLMIAASGATRALEIGGASGYSAIWMGMGLRETGGRLVTIEYDPDRAAELAENIRRAGLSDIVEVVAGDAFERIPALPGTFDFVFLDAWKQDYRQFFETLYPRLESDGLFVAHNVVNKRDEMEEFLDAIQTHPLLWTTIVSPSDEGMSVSMKREPGPAAARPGT